MAGILGITGRTWHAAGWDNRDFRDERDRDGRDNRDNREDVARRGSPMRFPLRQSPFLTRMTWSVYILSLANFIET